MKVYEGTQWVAAYASLSGALIATDNLSDLTDTSAARSNLGLGTIATAASEDYLLSTGGVVTGTIEAPLFEGDLSGAQLFPAKAGEALTKGDALYISGVSGNKPVVMKADANDPAKMPSFGLADATVSNNAAVNCVTYGQIHNVDTTGFALGDTLYVSTTAGALTATPPAGEASLIQNLGKVERVHASAGALFVAGSGRANATPNLNDGNFFLGNASNQSASADFDDSVVGALSGGSGVSLSASGVIANTAPDQTVSLTGSGATSISGTYPSFTISSTNTTYSVGDGGLTQINFTSADNTKLDGIEALATADQTASEILTAIKTVDGSGSGLDADLLDGQQGSYYANESARVSVPSSGNYNIDNSTSPQTLGTGYLRHDFLNSAGPPGSSYRSVLSISSYTGGPQWTQLSFNYNQGLNTPIYFRQNQYNGSTWSSWKQLWDSDNDGSGSGLDADLLDGQQGSYYASASSLSGYLPLTGGTVSGTTSFSYLQNTAGSKLEVMGGADANQNGIYMWDSTDSNWGIYMAQAGANRSLSGGTACNSLDGRALHHIRFRTYGSDSYRGWIFENESEAAKVSITSDTGKIYSTGDHYVGSNVVWHAGNDGSGSGLDADLLDGQQGSYYQPASTAITTANIGSQSVSSANNIDGRGFVNTGSNSAMNADTIDSNGISYYTSGVTNFSGNAADGALYSQQYSTSWQHQIAGDYRSGQIAIRGKNNGAWQPWNKVWTAGNDGSGSGLDADLLDGVQGASFLRSDASDTATGSVSLRAGGGHLGNHEFASASSSSTGYADAGIEIREGAYGSTAGYAAPRIGFHWGGVVASNISMDAAGAILIRNNPGTGYENFRANNIYANGTNLVWNAGNDGSGSGLDADSLDGQHGSSFIGKAGNTYYQHNTWIQGSGAYGLYNPSVNNAHFYPNTASTYGTWRIGGSRNGYTGIYLDTGGVTTSMYDGAGNGGEYRESLGRWYTYHNVANNCMGLNGSNTSSAYGLYVTGAIYSNGNITAYSDRRVKENIRTIDNALETVEEMRGVYYNRIDDEEKKTVIGFIAQEVDEIEGAKPLVTYAEDVDQYGVSYGNTAALLVEAVKELSQQVKDLQAEVKELKNG